MLLPFGFLLVYFCNKNGDWLACLGPRATDIASNHYLVVLPTLFERGVILAEGIKEVNASIRIIDYRLLLIT
jgi:hypothetical protein